MPRLVILTEGHSNPHTAKTACSVIRYRGEDVAAVLDSTRAGRRASEVLGVGEQVPVIAALAEAPEADTLLIGIAPPGGKIPQSWRAIVLEAIRRGMNVVSGLHDHLSDDAEFAAAAREHGVELIDVRKTNQREIARREGLRPDCFRVHTVGHDCSIGKMVVSIEICNELKRRGRDAKFVATGQTGIMVEGDGCPIDSVVADFVSGAAERLVLANQHHEILLIEGQGSLAHPAYSSVTLGLLHGCAPQAMILCYEVGRTTIGGLDHVPIPPLARLREVYETMASLMQPSRVIGLAMNSRKVSPEAADAERERLQAEFGLPVCDVFRHGPAPLADAVEEFWRSGEWRI